LSLLDDQTSSLVGGRHFGFPTATGRQCRHPLGRIWILPRQRIGARSWRWRNIARRGGGLLQADCSPGP
jgi:hypothetical protein